MSPTSRSLLRCATLPTAQILLGSTFIAGNAALAAFITSVPLTLARFLTVSVVTLLLFSRTRLDWRLHHELTDRDRPLVERGKMLVLGTAAVEAVFASQLGSAALLAWLAALAFGLLSVREFFLARWLAPRRELMALLQSIRAVFVGAFVVAGVTGLPIDVLGNAAWGLSLANWALYSLYVFARRTFGREEEVANSLSSRLTPAGAALACTALIAAANGLLILAPLPSSSLIVGASAVATVVALFYATEPRHDRALIFRATMTVFFIGFYAGLASSSLLT